MLQQDPVEAFDTPFDALVAATTDPEFSCPTRLYTQQVAQNQQEPVYRYFYTHVMDAFEATERLGAGHGIELFFVFQTLQRTSYPADEGDQNVESAMLN